MERSNYISRWCLVLLASYSLSLVSALPQATTTATSDPAFPTMSAQDGFGVPEGGAGSTNTNEAAGGAAGSDNGSAWNISTGGIVGISVGIAVVVLGIAGMWWLWYMAKKRQWEIRETIRRASRRVVGLKNPPRTPRTPRTPAPATTKSTRRTTVYVKPSATSKVKMMEVDLEEGRPMKPMKPSPGWLAEDKERSRSGSRDEKETATAPKSTSGWASKLNFLRK